jgi:hypothetical protein
MKVITYRCPKGHRLDRVIVGTPPAPPRCGCGQPMQEAR